MGYGGPSNLSAEIARKALSSEEQSAQEHDTSEARATLDKAELEALESRSAGPEADRTSVGTAAETQHSPHVRVPATYLVAAATILLVVAAILLMVLPQAT